MSYDDERAPDDRPRCMEFVGIEDPGSELGGLFCTHRLGGRWADLADGDRLTLQLQDPATGELETYGEAEVHAVRVGPVDTMVRAHCGLNHGCRQREAADRERELTAILCRAYGRSERELYRAGQATVVYMRVVDRG